MVRFIVSFVFKTCLSLCISQSMAKKKHFSNAKPPPPVVYSNCSQNLCDFLHINRQFQNCSLLLVQAPTSIPCLLSTYWVSATREIWRFSLGLQNVIPLDRFDIAPRRIHVIANHRAGDAPEPCNFPRTQFCRLE